MIDKNKLIKVIKEYNIDYDAPIQMETVSSIMHNYWWLDFYLEQITSDAWEWDAFCYLDYYDENARAVICIVDVGWELNSYVESDIYDVESDEDLADRIIEWSEIVEDYRKKFLYLKKK